MNAAYFNLESLTDLSGFEMSNIEGGLAYPFPHPYPTPFPIPFPIPKPFPIPDPMPWPVPDVL